MMSISINVNNSSFGHGSSVIGTIYEGALSNQETAALCELRAIRQELASAPDLCARIESIEKAISERDQPKVRSITRELAMDFSSSLLSNLASGGLLAFLGL